MCEKKWPKRPKFKAIVIIIIRLVFRCISVVVKCLNVRMSCKWLVAVAVSLDGCSIATDVCVNMLLPTQSISRMLCYMLTIYIYIYIKLLSVRETVFC